MSFNDREGFKHTVEVQAETLYEAVALAVTNFGAHDCMPAGLTDLSIEVMPLPVVHSVKLKTVQDWASIKGGRSPKELMHRERVRELLDALPKP